MQMSDLRDLEARLVAALDRMRAAYAGSQEALRVARGQVSLAQKERDEVIAQLSAQPEAEVDTAALDASRAEVASLTSDLATARAKAEELEAELATANSAQSQSTAGNGAARLTALQDSGAVEDLQTRVSQLETTMDQLRNANAQLRTNNAALREAHASGLPDAELINAGLSAELEALKATRAADRAEIDSVLAALQPLLGENAGSEGANSDA